MSDHEDELTTAELHTLGNLLDRLICAIEDGKVFSDADGYNDHAAKTLRDAFDVADRALTGRRGWRR